MADGNGNGRGSIRNAIIMEKLEKIDKKVHDVREALYNPDNGIYKRINSVGNRVNMVEEYNKNQKWFNRTIGGAVLIAIIGAIIRSLF